MSKTTPARSLTHDEQKAAEAAFAGRPFNPTWSQSARVVYEGLTRALPTKAQEPAAQSDLPEVHDGDDVRLSPLRSTPNNESTQDAPASEHPARSTPGAADNNVAVSRQEAIDAGALIDVSSEARKLGLTFPVTVTRPLWDIGIAPDQALTDEEKAGRLRDILMAFRLKLLGQTSLSPLIDFPAMLAIPAQGIPQPMPLFALIQPDPVHQATVTLLLPSEVSTTIIPMN